MSIAAPQTRPAPGLHIGVLLIVLSATAPLSVDMFLPSMPAMTREFGSTESTLTLGVTLFLFSFAGSQLFYGPASDRWGRRPVLFAGLVLFTVGGVVCVSAQTAEVLIAGRILQGVGGGVGPAMANAMVLDIYGRERAGKIIGYMSIVLPLAPAIAPIIGGFLEEAWGWRSVFVVLTGLGVVLAGTYGALMGETRPPREPGASSLARNYRTLYSSPTYVTFAVVLGLMFGGQLLFISTSSFVLIDHLGLSPRAYGFSFATVALGLMLGATMSSRLVDGWGTRRVVLTGTVISVGASGVMTALALAGIEHVAMIMVPMVVISLGFGLSRPSAMAGALVPFPHIAGVASSMLVFTQMTLSSGYNIAYTAFIEPGVVALSIGVFATVTVALATLILVLFRKPRAGEAARAP